MVYPSKALLSGVRHPSCIVALCRVVVVVCASASGLSAQTYSARNDFSLAANPNGVWSYGTLSSETGGAFSPFALTKTNSDFTGEIAWYNGGSYPNESAVYSNDTGQSVDFATVTVTPDQLNLDGQNFIAAVRWTAPTDGIYNVSGLFERHDNQTNAGPVAVTVGIVQDGGTMLYQQSSFVTYLSQQTFNLSALPLKAGTTLDFAEIPSVPHNDSTGLAATITYAGVLDTPVVNVTATTLETIPGSGIPAIFTLTRTGDLSQPLTVGYTVKGSAQGGVDYAMLKGTKKFKAGNGNAQIKVQPIAEENPAAKKTVKLTLQPGGGYTVGASATAKVKIVSD